MSAFAIAALLAVGPPTSSTDPVDAIALDWSAPNECPQRDVVEERLRELLPELGSIAAADAPARLRVEGRIEPAEAGRWAISLAFDGERGRDERSFLGPDCTALADAAALVIAVTVDPLGVSLTLTSPEPEPPSEAPDLVEDEVPSLEPPDEPDDEVDPVPESTQIVLPNDEDEPDEPTRARFVLALLGGGGYGPLRLAQAGLGAELGVMGPWWRAGVRGLWLPPRNQSYAGGDSARFDGFAIAARGCGVPEVGRVELPICAGVEGGLVRGEGRGSTPDPRDASLPWAAILVGPSVRYAFGRVAIGLDLELVASLVRGGFTIADSVIQRVAPVGVRALAAVELRLP